MRLFEISQDKITLEEKIATECSDYLKVLKEVPEHPLLHGTRGHSRDENNYYIDSSRTDRVPMTSNAEISRVIDWGLDSIGVEARRLNSIYATTSHKLAKYFGEVFQIYPKNGFHYTWCENDDDLVFDFDSVIKYGAYSYTSQFTKALKDYLDKYPTSNPSMVEDNYHGTINRMYLSIINNVPEQRNLPEIYMRRLPEDHPIKKQFGEFKLRTNFNINNMVKVLGLHSDTNLKEALLSGHEIWIKGTYIAVRSGILDDRLI